MVFDLSQNPYHLLSAPLEVSVEDLADLVQDTVLEGRANESSVASAQQALISPRARLDAELGWLADTAPDSVAFLANMVLRAGQEEAIFVARGAAPLTRANAAAHICGRFPQSLAPLLLLIEAWNELDQNDVFLTIVAVRERVGFPRPNRKHFDEAINQLQAVHAKQAVESLANQNSPGPVLATIVEKEIARKAIGSMLRRIVRQYDKVSEQRVESVREEVKVEIDGCRERVETASNLVANLHRHLAAWNNINRPVQLLEQAEGHEEERSRRLCHELRNLALWLANEQGRHQEALQINRLLLENFTGLDSISSQLKKDITILEDIVKQLTPSYRNNYKNNSNTHINDSENSGGFGFLLFLVLLVAVIISLGYFGNNDRTASRSEVQGMSRPNSPPPAANPPPTRQRAAPSSSPTETAPPPNISRALTAPELRYCTFQNARLDHLRSMISQTSQNEINRFNALISEYNTRCGRFSYRSGALAPVEAEARRRDAEFQRDASAILAGWRRPVTPTASTSSRASPAPPPPSGTTMRRSPDPVSPSNVLPLGPTPALPRLLDLRDASDARIVQRRLQELGYYQASIDGGFGPLSIAALRAFKQNHPRLPADDEWDLETQRALLSQ